MKNKKVLDPSLREVKTAGYKWSKREKNVNRKAGLHDKIKKSDGETRVKRRKPLALAHVRRMRKVAVLLGCVVVGGSVAAGVGFLREPEITTTDKVFKTVCYPLPEPPKDPTEYTLVETVGFMNYALQNQPHWSSSMASTVNALGFKQTVQNYKQYYKGILISADIAEGFSQKANQFCVIQDKELVLWRPSANKKFNGMDTQWSTGSAEGCTISEFRENRGFPPNEFSVYVLNENTIANAQDYSVVSSGDGTYTMTVELKVNQDDDEQSADYYYRQQMKITGDLSDQPTIKSTNVTYTFDSSWRVLNFTIKDEYTALGMPCSSQTDVKYSYAEEDAKNSFYDDYFKEYEKNYAQAEKPDGAPNPLDYITAAFTPILTDGAVLNLDLKFDELTLNGSIFVALKDGSLSDVRAQLGDIYIMIDEDMTLFVSDGNAKYKLGIGSLLVSETSEETAGGLDAAALIDQLTAGEFTLTESSAVLKSKLELFGLEINLEFNFKIENGVTGLNFLYAEIPFNGKTITARAVYGSDADIPAKPQNTSEFRDILNEGISLDISLGLNSFKLNGYAGIIMQNGQFGGALAELGDFAVYCDYPADMLYLTDGNVKYKLPLSALSGMDIGGSSMASDMSGLLKQVLDNISAGNGKISTALTLDILEQTISAALGINLTGGIRIDAALNFANSTATAQVSLGNREISIPDTVGYVDLLNTGITLETELVFDNLRLSGNVQIVLENGKFTALKADFNELAVYYYANTGKLYVTDGNVKYYIDTNSLNKSKSGGFDISEIIPNFDIKTLAGELLKNVATSQNGISSNVQLTVLGQAIQAAAGIKLDGGLQVNADLTIAQVPVSVKVKLSAESVADPVFAEYSDLLNTGVTLSVGMTVDELRIDGEISVILSNGSFAELRADFGDIKVYYIASEQALYLQVGETKAFIPVSQIETDAVDVSSIFDLKATFGGDISAAVTNLLQNIATGIKEISVNTSLKIFDSFIPVGVTADISNGIKLSANVTAFGVDVKADIGLTAQEVPALGAEDKEQFVNVLENGWAVIDGLLGENISANVSGTVYSYTQEYADADYVKYSFEASLEYDKGNTLAEDGTQISNPFPIHIDTGVVGEDGKRTGVNFYIDSTLYLHFNLKLVATDPSADSLYLDLWLFDANPATDGKGITTGAYSQDNELDVYIKVSKYGDGASAEPLCLYAPASEIMTLVSMVGASADLHGLTFENSAELTKLASDIADLVDELLINKYLPYTHEQFASLGNSLIPQILGVDLNELLNKLLGSAETVAGNAGNFKIDFSKEYVSGLKYSENNLEIKLDSALLFGDGATDNLTVNLAKTQIDGVDYVSAIRLDNVYMGGDNTQKLNLGLNLNYNGVSRPADMAGYRDLRGIDTLLKSLVNSATHETENSENSYDLNGYYLLQGNIKANVTAIGFVNADAVIDIKSVSVYIDEVTNNVSINAHIFYNYVKKLGVVAIDRTADVYISMRLGNNQGGGNIIIKKLTHELSNGTKYPVPLEEVRSMTLNEFSADIVDNLTFILSFGSVITDNINKSDDSSSGGISFDGYDYGKYLNTILSYYIFNETYIDEVKTGASWTVAVNGGLLEQLTGMTASDIAVKFSAGFNAKSGMYTVNSVEILKSSLKLWGGIVSVGFSGEFTYCNPHEQMGDGYTDTSIDLFNIGVSVKSDYAIPNLETEFTAPCGSYVKLPLGTVVENNGQKYMLDGYTSTVATGGTQNVVFESYVEENGVKYGLTLLTSDTVYTAVWGKAYTVTYCDENGNVLHSVVYRENDVLDLGNMPACPERDRYTAEWIGANGPANGTAVTEDLTFKAEYTKASLKVTLNSATGFNYEGYDGNYSMLNLGFAEGADYILKDAVSADGYTFLGWWYNDNGSWRKVVSVEEFNEAGKVTLEALWAKISLAGNGVKSSQKYTVSFNSSCVFAGTESLSSKVVSVSYAWESYSWGSYSNRGSCSSADIISSHTFDTVSSNFMNSYEKWRITATVTIELPDKTTQSVTVTDEGKF